MFARKSVQSAIRCFSSKKTYDYVIMGGGPMGSSAALHLAQAGHKNILVIEKDFGYKYASAMLSAGGVRQQFSVPENIKMSIYGASFIKNMDALAVNGEVPDIQFHENGYLFLGGDKSKHILETNLKTQKECGADWIEGLNKAQLAEKFPWLNTDSIDLGSFGFKNEGYFDPWLLVGAMKAKAISLGVEYVEGKVVGGKLVPATASSTSSFNLSSISVIGTKTGTEMCFSGGKYVNASGAWSSQVLASFASSLSNPSAIHPLPVRPRKRCIFAVHCPGLIQTSHPMPPCKTPLVVDPTGVYFRPEGKKVGKFICGVSPPEDQDREISPENELRELEYADHELFNEIIWPALYERVPAFEELKVTSSWAGFYDYNVVDQVRYN